MGQELFGRIVPRRSPGGRPRCVGRLARRKSFRPWPGRSARGRRARRPPRWSAAADRSRSGRRFRAGGASARLARCARRARHRRRAIRRARGQGASAWASSRRPRALGADPRSLWSRASLSAPSSPGISRLRSACCAALSTKLRAAIWPSASPPLIGTRRDELADLGPPLRPHGGAIGRADGWSAPSVARRLA